MIDNYDSFTFNLYQMLSEAGAKLNVVYNDKVSAADLKAADAVVISPGPGAPEEAGQCMGVIRDYSASKPIFGVCLGHQAMTAAFGGKVVRAAKQMHGKQSKVYHDGKTLYAGLPNPITVGRYHSLIADEKSLPADFEVASYTRDGEIMGIRHKRLPLEGVQFHPESILTEHGATMLKNFLASLKPTA
ncbi:MAG: aminodeoxychorismate/anthranilate synthase component II [Planctomycetes bacterium]|nr:aminodeoxychorismate/anthranilate synthase component II [Planctomycetota bacterium]